MACRRLTRSGVHVRLLKAPYAVARLTLIRPAVRVHQMWEKELEELTLTYLDPETLYILDYGCGSGVWTRAIAAKFPNANVTGIDTAPSYQNIHLHARPRNCWIFPANVNRSWSRAIAYPGEVDFICTRMTAMAIVDWPTTFDQAYYALRPGGLIECQDIHFELGCDDRKASRDAPLMQWFSYMEDLLERTGTDPYVVVKHAERLWQAGFKFVEQTHFK